MFKYAVKSFVKNDSEKIFLTERDLINYVHKTANEIGYDKLECENHIGLSKDKAISFLIEWGYTVRKRLDEITDITYNYGNYHGVDIEGIVDGKKFGQWHESIQDFNDYFDVHLDLSNWDKSVSEAKEYIAKYLERYDCDEYILF
ncbi:hypothetical protein NYZ94_00155 (plasmid) [Ligilactobacillus salivarius]|nr:hypothetical protein NYZ94_00155 [Ligilactobacillus salivarius]